MQQETFSKHVGDNDRPDPSWSRALQALWYAEKPDWDTAHTICQQGNTPVDFWIHAHLHREEGDLNNARYWYQRADKPEHKGTLQEERSSILATVVATGTLSLSKGLERERTTRLAQAQRQPRRNSHPPEESQSQGISLGYRSARSS